MNDQAGRRQPASPGQRRMRRFQRVGVTAISFAVFVLAASWFLEPRAAALPAGATRLALITQQPPLLPISFGCPLGLLGPVTVGSNGDAMTFTGELTNQVLKISWPAGWSARSFAGVAELVRPNGAVFARSGDKIRDTLTGGTDNDDTFIVCSTDPVALNPLNPSP